METKTVQPVRRIRHPPVIEKIVVKQGPADQASHIYMQPQPRSNPNAQERHCHRVVKAVYIAMLRDTPLSFHPRGGQNVSSMLP